MTDHYKYIASAKSEFPLFTNHNNLFRTTEYKRVSTEGAMHFGCDRTAVWPSSSFIQQSCILSNMQHLADTDVFKVTQSHNMTRVPEY